MYNELSKTGKIETGSVYLDIIAECKDRIDAINVKLSIISFPPAETIAGADTPNRTELEAQLKSLLNKIKTLNDSIVV